MKIKFFNLVVAVLCALLYSIVAVGIEGVDLTPEEYRAEDSTKQELAYARSLCNDPDYYCKAVKPSDSWYHLWPNEKERDLIMRLNRTNVALTYRSWVVLPKHPSRITLTSISPFPQTINPPGHKLLLVDLTVFAFAAYDAEGKLIYWGPATGGQNWCDDTHSDCRTQGGNFSLYRIEGKQCVSKTYPPKKGGAPMPYCMFYYKGFAIHGSTLSGFNNRSRGCVRVFYEDAKWLYNNFAERGIEVIVNTEHDQPVMKQAEKDINTTEEGSASA